LIFNCATNKKNSHELFISAHLLDDSFFIFNDSEEDVNYIVYNKFKIVLYDDYNLIIKDKKDIIKLKKDIGCMERFPRTINPPSWEIKISNNKVIEFENMFCEINKKQKQKIMSVSIPEDWLKHKK
jgi:hypothetical protein